MDQPTEWLNIELSNNDSGEFPVRQGEHESNTQPFDIFSSHRTQQQSANPLTSHTLDKKLRSVGQNYAKQRAEYSHGKL